MAGLQARDWEITLRRVIARHGRTLPLLLGLVLAQPAQSADEGGFVLTADRVTYLEAENATLASGNVEISRGTRRLLADEVRYDQTSDRVFAKGHVALTEEKGDTFFGEEVELQGDLRDGFVNGVRVLRTDDSRFAANRAVRRDGRTTELDKAVYSPCPICADSPTPLWQLKAERVVHDETAQTVTYRNALIEFFGVPVAYTPYFRHPDPTVERQTGFLAPSFGTSSELGLLIETPYYWTLAPNRDVTFSPIFTQTDGVVLQGQYRELRKSGRTDLSASLAYADAYEREETGESGGRDLRGHIKGTGRYPVAEHTEAGFDAFLTTDNSYLNRYKISSDSVLDNRAYVERAKDRDLLSLNGYYFQGLREDDKQDQIPIALPLAESRLVSEPLRWGSHWSVDSSVLALTRLSGLDTRRVSSRAGWQVPLTGPAGTLYRLEASVRGDLYQTDGDPESFEGAGGSNAKGRVLPRLTGDWSWPLVGDSAAWTYEVEPVASVNLAPGGGNSNGIPNEDSRDFEFDDTNLFEAIRFPGLDRNEGGGKVAYGLRSSAFGPGASQVSGLLGQSYRLYGSSPFGEGSGLEDRLSDYVGRVDVRPHEWLDLGFRFRLAREELELRRSDLDLGVGPSWLRFDISYLNLSREPDSSDQEGFESREEVTAGVRASVTPRLALGLQTRRDVDRNATVANQVGLIYSHPCLTLLAGLEQSFTRRGEVEDETTLLFRVALKNLGELETGNFLGL